MEDQKRNRISNAENESLLSKIHHRFSWEKYIQEIQVRRKIWKLLRSRRLSSYLATGCLLERHASPILSMEDPILNDPNIERNFSSRVEYLYKLEGGFYIEPDFGYPIMNPASILDIALPGSEMAQSRSTMSYFSGIPSLIKYIRAKSGLVPVRVESAVVLMRHVFDSNYYHFYNDVMSRLRLLDECGIDDAIPLVVSAELGQKEFFQRLCSRGSLATRNWIIQDGFYISAGELIFAKPFSEGNKLGIDHFLDCIHAPEASKLANRRVFLNRDPSRGRYILNMNDIKPLLDDLGFEIIDTDHLSIEQQMSMFSEAGIVIGIHGAGLTNIIFRRGGNLKLLEIFPPHDTNLSFYILAKIYDYDYDHIKGYQAESGQRHAPFHLDPHELKKKLAAICKD